MPGVPVVGDVCLGSAGSGESLRPMRKDIGDSVGVSETEGEELRESDFGETGGDMAADAKVGRADENPTRVLAANNSII